ncbi:MAG: hypothetical protein KC618_07520 [Candidatus Omnitrophica bacterium]|nr:hypothetical protein [Candidatus Omnitrophota bacterium]
MKKIKLTKKEKERLEAMDYEIAFYEGILKNKPDFIEALSALGDLYTKRGFIEKGLKADVKLSILKPEDPYVFYNLACSYSLLENVDEALSSIKQAIELGYKDFNFLEQDDDLENLRKDQRFQRYLARMKNRKDKQQDIDKDDDQRRP